MDHSKLLPYTSSHNINRKTSAITYEAICHWSTSLQIVDGDMSDGNITGWNLDKTNGDAIRRKKCPRQE